MTPDGDGNGEGTNADNVLLPDGVLKALILSTDTKLCKKNVTKIMQAQQYDC